MLAMARMTPILRASRHRPMIVCVDALDLGEWRDG